MILNYKKEKNITFQRQVNNISTKDEMLLKENNNNNDDYFFQ